VPVGRGRNIMTRLSQEQLKKIGVAPAKYHNKKTEIDGHKFDSKKEAAKYSELVLLQKAGEISDIKLQPSFLLQEGFRDKTGYKHRAITYIADFMVVYPDGKVVVMDSKGMRTDVFKIKLKLFIKRYPDYEFIEC
jgi:hypothetical protein